MILYVTFSTCIYCMLLLFTNAMRELAIIYLWNQIHIMYLSKCIKINFSWSLIYMCGCRNKYYY